jgi:hypothetical protein
VGREDALAPFIVAGGADYREIAAVSFRTCGNDRRAKIAVAQAVVIARDGLKLSQRETWRVESYEA